MKDELLRQLPRVDDLLGHPILAPLAAQASRELIREAVRVAIEEARQRIMAGDRSDLSPEAVAKRAHCLAREQSRRSLRRVVNATGVILHTNLGRAPFSPEAQQTLADAVAGYCNVQADMAEGRRVERETHVRDLLSRITGAEDCLVVNNNAAATVLALNSLAAGREVVLSRGEMVEIGGAFRIPEILQLAGCRLVEVGCTNRTHLRDYEKAITPATALLMLIHQSNYRMIGFASQVEIGPLAELARLRGIACCHDLGSGALLDLARFGLPREPSAPESLAAGADVVLFSGDKLLGGPQCGIILGKAALIATMRKNPYYRIFRVCKMTLACLEATLRLFTDPESLPRRHRVMAMLAMQIGEIRLHADELADRLRVECGAWLEADTVEAESEVGGGSLAGHPLPTVAVRVRPLRLPVAELARRLRMADTPVFCRVRDDALLLDPRTILPGEDDLVLAAFRQVAAGPERP